MSLAKNKGPLLTSKFRGGLEDIPREFLAYTDYNIFTQNVPVDIDPDTITGLLVESKVEQTRDNERKKSNSVLSRSPVPLISGVKLQSGLVGVRTRSLVTDPTPLIIDNLTDSADQHNLGNGFLDQTIVEAPSLFTHEQFRRTRPDVTPQDFGALLQTDEESLTAFGIAVDPTLVDGDLDATDEQLDVFTHRTSRRTIDLVDLPAFFTNYKTNRYKQPLISVRELRVDDNTPYPPTALGDSTYTVLGDGTALVEFEGTEVLFDQHVFSRERPDVVPEWAKAILPVFEEAFLETDIAVDPDPLSAGVYLERQQQEDVFNRRVTRRSRNPADLPIHRIGFNTNRYKQIETITETLESDLTTAPTPTALSDVVFEILGDGSAIERVTEVDSLFTEHMFERSIPDVTPEWAKALLQTKIQETNVTGTAADPTLVAGDLSRSEKQYDVFNKRTSRTFRDLTGLPKQRVSYRTNRYKQIETVTDILEDDGTTPDVPTALKDVTFEILGDGNAVEQHIEIDDVFDQKSRSTELPDLLPDIFKAVLPTYVHEDVITGTSVTDPPVLTSGDFFKSETRETEFTKKVIIRGRAGISLPASVTAFRRIGGEQYGSEVTKMDGYLDDSEPSVETGLDVVTSKVTDLGNGTWFRETEKLDVASVWPTLDGQYFDKEMQVNALTEEQTVDSSFTPATPGVGDYWVESKKPLDNYHAKRILLTRTPTADSLANALIEEVDGPFQFPGIVYLAPSGLGYYRRQASAQLCQQTIRTWWMSSATKPTRGLPGSMADVEVQDIIMDDIIISTLNDVFTLAYSGMCLHDAITTFGTFVYAATTPSAADYIALIGSEIVVGASIDPTDIPNLWKIQTKSVVAR